VTIFDGLDPNPTLRRENQIRTIHSSLLIENNSLTLYQVTAVLDGHHVLAPAKDIREVQNAYEAYEAAADWDPYSFDNLLRAHAMMMAGLVKHPGCLRNDDVGVYAGDVLIHPGSPASVVPQVMSNLFDWLRSSSDHPLIKGSVFHYEFEFIHPFTDGNGRTGRLWHSLILRRWRPIFAWMPVETLVHRNQQAYYDALLEAGNRGDSTIFVEFMLETIRAALADVRAQQAQRHASDGQAMGKRWASDGQAMGKRLASERQAQIIAMAREREQIRASEVANLLNVSRQRARRLIKDMTDAGLLIKHGNGRYTYYTLTSE
jgi:Fic family protein